MKFARKISGNPLSYLKSLPWFPRGMSWFLTILCLQLFTGCYYYTVKGLEDTGTEVYAEKIREFNASQKYIVLHQNASALHLQNATLDKSSMVLKGKPVLLSEEHVYKQQIETGKSYRYKKKKQYPLNEVHLYISDDVNVLLDEWVSIPLTDIQKVAFTKQDKTRSVINGVLGFIGVIVLIMIIVALTKSSCPFLYVDGGEGMVFQGELYPGSIIKNAQKPDFLPLPLLKEREGQFNLKITNELMEIQHTDQAILKVIDHPADARVYLSPQGEPYTIQDPVPPVRAFADGVQEISQNLRFGDQITWSFETPRTSPSGTRYVDLEFDPVQKDGELKLLLSLRNTLWLDYVIGSFYKKFGSYYTQFQRDQQDVTAEEAFKWRSDQSLPLSVYLETAKGWELQYEIPAMGPMAFREIVVPLKSQRELDGPVRLRLETGFMFWELDRIALDTSADIPFMVQTVYPNSARDHNGREVSDLLRYQDGAYLTQREVGNSVSVCYDSPARLDESRSVFLKNTGYYTYIRDFDGVPDFSELRKFREPGHFTKFAEAEFHKVVQGLITRHPDIADRHEK